MAILKWLFIESGACFSQFFFKYFLANRRDFRLLSLYQYQDLVDTKLKIVSILKFFISLKFYLKLDNIFFFITY